MLVLQEVSLERECELPAGGWEWLDKEVVGLEDSFASYWDDSANFSLFFFVTGDFCQSPLQ